MTSPGDEDDPSTTPSDDEDESAGMLSIDEDEVEDEVEEEDELLAYAAPPPETCVSVNTPPALEADETADALALDCPLQPGMFSPPVICEPAMHLHHAPQHECVFALCVLLCGKTRCPVARGHSPMLQVTPARVARLRRCKAIPERVVGCLYAWYAFVAQVCPDHAAAFKARVLRCESGHADTHDSACNALPPHCLTQHAH